MIVVVTLPRSDVTSSLLGYDVMVQSWGQTRTKLRRRHFLTSRAREKVAASEAQPGAENGVPVSHIHRLKG